MSSSRSSISKAIRFTSGNHFSAVTLPVTTSNGLVSFISFYLVSPGDIDELLKEQFILYMDRPSELLTHKRLPSRVAKVFVSGE